MRDGGSRNSVPLHVCVPLPILVDTQLLIDIQNFLLAVH